MDYAIVDTAGRPDAALALRRYADGHMARSLFARQPEAGHMGVGPWLIRLDDSPAMRSWLDPIDRQLGAVGRLSSDNDFDVVFRHLEARLDMRLMDGRLALFRFWDGRALYRVWRVMTPEQRRAFLGPFTRWSVRLPNNTWELDRSILETA
ncbi:DUF4123 domain-containing protein [Stenotrophomonas sp. LGBM10]|uniref:DUF4123 domain-containing protein n=1 Tax=Stenotrophomonas sp. LGBM10 TaxID=3390038 RepID=UPI00398B6A70